MARKRDRQRAQTNLCSTPGCQNLHEDGFKKCASCRSYYNDRRKVKGRTPKTPGMCSMTDCTNQATDGFKLCERCRRRTRERQQADPHYNEEHRLLTRRQRNQVLDHYGRRCACCGEGHEEFLTIDHVNGDGAQHLTTAGYRYRGPQLYGWLIRNDFPEGFRTLCFNCNFALGHHGYCPHGSLTQEVHTGRKPTQERTQEEKRAQRERNQYYQHQRKMAVLHAYGGPRCPCCGEDHIECLTIDHIADNGAAHRLEINGTKKGSGNLYLWLKREGFPPGFRVLCMNCNWAAHYHPGPCPHQQ